MDTLRKGDRGSEVESLQIALSQFGVSIAIDSDFGPQTHRTVMEFQEFRCYNRGEYLGVDGVYGPKTDSALDKAQNDSWTWGAPWEFRGAMVYGWRHPHIGSIPSREGKLSSFGGPDDKGDRLYGQALIGAKNMAQVYEHYPELVGLGIFTSGLRDPLPSVRGIKWTKGKAKWVTKTAGVSYGLNVDSYYVAARWRYGAWPKFRSLPDPRPVRFLCYTDDELCLGVPTDWGPAKRTGRDFDLSPGWMAALGVRTDNSVRALWAADDSAIGPVTEDHYQGESQSEEETEHTSDD